MTPLGKLARSLLLYTGAMLKPKSGPDYLEQQVARSWRKEQRNLQWLGLRDGMSILDLGCGPGHFTRRLAEWLPNARITALDSRSSMLALARERLSGRASVVEAPAERTALESESFDFVLARLLFQHLQDPALVAHEAYRLLKPGGKLVITDVDDDLFGIVEPRVPGLKRVLARYGRAQALQGGNRRIGRKLFALLKAAGFTDLEIEAIAIDSYEAGMEACLPQLDVAPLKALMAQGHLSKLEYAALRGSRRGFGEATDRMALVLLLMACGTRPTIS